MFAHRRPFSVPPDACEKGRCSKRDDDDDDDDDDDGGKARD